MYNWFKVIHIVGFVAWFAGIFYIWRLFVYHSETKSQDVKDTLTIMERKLYKIIMMPAMVITILFGGLMFWEQWNVFKISTWIWLKMLLVILVLAQHFLADYYRLQLLNGKVYPSKKFRILNEFPTILLIFIVILVIIKPFGIIQ